MKILELIPSLSSGGAEQFVVQLSNQLSSEGYEVILGQLYYFRTTDILSHSLDRKIPRVSFHKKMGFDIRVLFNLCQFINKEKIDIVHSHASATSYLVLAAFFCRKSKFFSTIHTDAKREAGGVITKTIRKLLFTLKKSTPVTISDESHKSFVNLYNLNAPIINNGYPPFIELKDDLGNNPFHEKGDYKIFVHIARSHPVKNQEMLYKVILKLNENGYRVKLFHYGKFDNSDLSVKLFHYNSEIINICGETLNPRRIIKYADACCLSSLMEGMPMTIIEAFSVGCPVISTPVGGCKDMIKHFSNGLLSENTSLESYYYTLKQFLDMNELQISEMKKNAYNSFSNFTIEKTASKYIDLFKRT